ncbi:transporter substrate-binding domain-containing protein, partial [Cellulomonas sp. zg-Y138]
GAVDAVTTDDIILAGLASQPSNVGKVKVVGNPFSEENYGVGLPQDNTTCQQVNDAITAMIEDGTWQELLDANVGESGYKANEELNPPEVQACA